MSINIVNNLIDKQSAKEIAELSSLILKRVDSRPGFYEDQTKRPILPEEEALQYHLNIGCGQEEAVAASKISAMLYKIKQTLEEFYGVGTLDGEGGIAKLTSGAFNGLHSDMYQINGDEWEDGSGRQSELEYSALLYLSDYGTDFTGGEIIFPQHDLKIEPMSGMLLFFRGDMDHLHRVSQVTSGERYCIVTFFGKSV